MKKILLGLIVVASFAAAGHRFYKMWYEHWPVAAVGECLALAEDSQAKMRVLKNDNKLGVTVGVMEVDMGFAVMQFFGQVKYKELRDMKIKKVKCHEAR